MAQVYIVYVTILLSVGCVSYVVHNLVSKYLKNKREFSVDALLLVGTTLKKLERAFDNMNPPIPDINEKVQAQVDKLGEDLKDIISKNSMMNVGKAFTPRRKG